MIICPDNNRICTTAGDISQGESLNISALKACNYHYPFKTNSFTTLSELQDPRLAGPCIHLQFVCINVSQATKTPQKSRMTEILHLSLPAPSVPGSLETESLLWNTAPFLAASPSHGSSPTTGLRSVAALWYHMSSGSTDRDTQIGCSQKGHKRPALGMCGWR